MVVVDLVGFGIVMPVLPYWSAALGASALQLGLLLSGYAAAQFVCAPLWGRLSDRVGRRPVMLATIAGTALSLFALGLSETLAALFVARCSAGAFAGGVSVASAWVSDASAPGERTRWMGRIGACYAIGFTLGPALGGPLSLLGYAAPMFAAAGLSALNFALAFFILKENAPPAHRAPRARARRNIFRHNKSALLAGLCFALAVTQLESMFQYLMLQRFQWELLDVAFLLVAMAVWMGAIQGGALPALARRYPERRLLIAGALLLAFAFAVLPVAPSATLLMLPLALLATGRGVAQPALMSLVSLRAHESERGVTMGAYQSSASLARVFGPALAGLLFDRAIALPFWFASALMLGVALLARSIPASPAGEGERA